MPENVITNILNRLPIQNAVRTSILSRHWRFKWKLLTQLVFDKDFFDSLLREVEGKYYDWRIIISRLVIHLQGPITKFLIDLPVYPEVDVENTNHWVMLLSRKGIKDLTLKKHYFAETEVKLPTHLFLCLELKYLNLRNCSFHIPPTFCGFSNLLSLKLCQVPDIDNWVEFITKCPLLEIMKFRECNPPIGKVKLADIAKLINLKMMSLPLYMLGDLAITSSTIFQLGLYLPKLQKLTLDFEECEFIEESVVRKWICTAFPCLKTLSLNKIDMRSSTMLSCAFEMIWGSPNLQTLKIIAADNEVGVLPPVFCFPKVDNNTKLQLQSVVFYLFSGSGTEVYFIKTLLACSPLLHNMTIYANSFTMFSGDKGNLMFASKLLELNRASPIAKVRLY